MYPTTVWADDRFSVMFGNNYPEWGNVMDLSLLNRGCRDESKGCTTFFTDICAVCLDDVWIFGAKPMNFCLFSYVFAVLIDKKRGIIR